MLVKNELGNSIPYPVFAKAFTTSMKFFLFILFVAAILLVGYLVLFDEGKLTEYISELTSSSPLRTIEEERPDTARTTVSETLGSIEQDFAHLALPFDAQAPFVLVRAWREGENWYVEYENSEGSLGQVLFIPVEGEYEAKALFVPSELGWELAQGQGSLIGPGALLYEKNAQGQWEKRN